MTQYVHHVPGRLRLRLPQVKRSQAQATQVETRLMALVGVRRVKANLVTGSVTVHYETDITHRDRILAAVAEHPAFAVDHVSPDFGTSEETAASELGRMLLTMVVDKAMERSARVLLGALI